MAVQRRFNPYSGFRWDIPHLRSIESAVSADFDNMLRGLITGLNRPLLIRGFDINIPNAAINATSLQITVADSALLHASATESGTILTVPAGTANETLDSSNTRVIGAFQNGVPNYVSLDYRRVTDTSTIDSSAGWSAAQKLEFQRTAPLGRLLEYRFIISASGFSTNLPLYIVGVSATGAVEYITKSTPNLFRLGSGGANPDPQYDFLWGSLTNNQVGSSARREWINESAPATSNPVTVAPGDDANAFSFGDFSIRSLKDWMDAVMTRFKEITGSAYWYLDSQLLDKPPNAFDTWFDSVGSNMTGAGSISYNYILESSAPSIGAFQSKVTDSAVLPTDSYVVGVTTSTKAIITSFNSAQLVINSVTNPATTPFLYQEVLQNRRIVRYDPAKSLISDRAPGDTNRYGYYQRLPVNSNSYVNVSSWSYDDRLITINTSSNHNYNPGDQVQITGLTLTAPPLGELSPTGVFVVKEVVSATQFKIHYAFKLTAAPSSGGQTRLDRPFNSTSYDAFRHPYLPRFKISSWSYVGLTSSIIATGHNFRAPTTQAGTISTGFTTMSGMVSTAGLRVGQEISGTGIPSNTMVEEILSSTSIRMSKAATASNSTTKTFYDVAMISGLTASTDAPNGRYRVSGLGLLGEIQITTALAPTGTAGLALDTSSSDTAAYIRYDRMQLQLSVSKAVPDQFNVIDAVGDCFDDTNVRYLIGPDSIPSLGNASGAITLDGVVAVSSVLDPIVVQGITNPTPGKIIITTVTPHQLVTTTGPLDFTIFGNSADSPYFRTFTGVTQLTVTGLNVFELEGTGLTGEAAYSNPGSDLVFIKYSNNPYPGPIQWDDDIVIKAIIGDKRFVIPATATADGTALANRFNVNGILGTAYLQDGEVAYIVLERNKSVSTGALFTASGGNQISGAANPVDVLGAPLVAGDFVKFEDEPENKWFRIQGTAGDPILTSTFFLENDRGQPVTISQRPARSGKLVYCKAKYDVVHVKQHWEVDASADIYWIAVRRDNGSLASKVYFRGLELEVGEVRQINDNQTTNLLQYTGAFTESATSPNYQSHDSTGQYQATQDLRVQQSDDETRMVTFYEGPDLGIQVGDRIRKLVGATAYTYSVKQVLTSRTVVLAEDLKKLSNISSISRAADGTVTVVTDLAHTLSNGDAVVISGVDVDEFNGAAVVTVTGPTSFTYKKVVTFNATYANGSNILSGMLAGDQVRLQVGMDLTGTGLSGTKTISSFPTGVSLAFTPGTASGSGTGSYTASFIGVLAGSGGFVSKNNPLVIGPSEDVIYLRQNYTVEDSDDLTMAIRKEDRELARINTALVRPIYDESFLVQQINMNGSGLIESGEYVYAGPRNNPTFLAWVLHGNGQPQIPYPIEGTAPPGGWPGGHPTVGPNAILVAVISGSITNGSTLYQKGVATLRTVNNPGNPPFTAPTIKGASTFGGNDGVEIVLPPNKRTQIAGAGYVQWPSFLTYKSSLNAALSGEELMVIINDSIRQANVDYLETFGGPKGKIQIQRDLPANTRIRARLMPAYGSALAAKAAGVTLQTAYDASFINNYTVYELSGKPITLITGDQPIGGSALDVTGSIKINGVYSGNVVGGIRGASDKGFDIGEETNRVNQTWTAIDHVKSHNSHPGSDVERFTAAHTTTSAAAAIIPGSNITVPGVLTSGRTYRVKAKATAWRSDGTQGSAAFELHGVFYREPGGDLLPAGSPASQIVGFSGDGLNYALAFGISGGTGGADGDIVVVAYGSSGTVQWAITVECQMVSSST